MAQPTLYGNLVGSVTGTASGNVPKTPGGVTFDLLSSSWFNVRDYGATGNGTTDDSAAVQAALTAAGAGSSVCFFPPGTYKIGATLTAAPTATLVGMGAFLRGAANPILSVTGAQTATVGAGGLVLDGLNFATTANNDAVQISTTAFAPAALGKPVTIRNCQFDGSTSTDGTLLTCTGGEGWVIAGCLFIANPLGGPAQAHGLRLFGATNYAVYGCTFKYLNPAIRAAVSGANVSQGLAVSSCIFNGCYQSIITVQCDGNTFTGNMIDNTGTVLISLDDFECTFVGNYCGCQMASAAAIQISTNLNYAGWQFVGNRFNCYVGGGTYVSIIGTATRQADNIFFSANVFNGPAPLYWIDGSYLGAAKIIGNNFASFATGQQVRLSNSTANFNVIKDNYGQNPVGFVNPPAFPASNVAAQNNLYYDVMAYVNYNGATVTGLKINGTSVPVSGTTFLLGPGETVTFTYTGGPPTWQWKGY